MTTLSHRSGKTPPKRRLARGIPKLGVNQARSSLIIAIKLCTGFDVKLLANDYFKIVDTWVRTRGIKDSTRRLKEIYTLALNSMVESPSKPEKSWIATNKRGFPRKFEFLERWYNQGSATKEDKLAKMQAILSILNWYRGMIAPGVPDLSTITDGPTRDTPPELLDLIATEGLHPKWKLDKEILSTVEMLLRFKQGPNGQATICSLVDLGSLQPSLYEAITGLLRESGFEGRQIAQSMKSIKAKVKPNPKSINSKLSIKREGGGKDRIFAMVDYWSQVALKPLHNCLIKILSEIPQDCTFDQSKGVEDMLVWSLSGTNSSIDLSSASDRFPIDLQERVLRNISGKDDLVKHWRSCMVDRDFYYKRKTYRWSVGQPLGSYSSWPSFALAHHCLVRYAHKLANQPLEYYILGDDLVIRNLKAATVYRELIDKLGIKVSESKSLTNQTIEFAKRLFRNGSEISPIPVPMIHSTVKDFGLLSECVSRLVERSINFSPNLRVSEFAREWSVINRTPQEKTNILCEFSEIRRNFGDPRDECLNEGNSYISWRNTHLPIKVIEWIHTTVKFQYLLVQYTTLWNKLGNIPKMLQSVELPGTPTSLRRMHPIYLANEKVREDLERATKEMREYLSSPLGSSVPLPSASVISLTGMVTGSKSLSRHNTKVIELTYNICQVVYNRTIELNSGFDGLKVVLVKELDDIVYDQITSFTRT